MEEGEVKPQASNIQQREDEMAEILRRVANGCSTVDDAKKIAEALAKVAQ